MNNGVSNEIQKKIEDEQILDLFNSTNITLADLAMRSNRTIKELKKLLMS